MIFAHSQSIAYHFGESASQAKIKEAEVSHQRPGKREHAKPIHSDPLQQQRNRNRGNEKRKKLSYDLPNRVARHGPTTQRMEQAIGSAFSAGANTGT